MSKEEMYNLGEVIFDMTLAINFMMPEDADIDSREIYDNIFEWATEFEKAWVHSDDDYYLTVDHFVTEKVSKTYGKWFD